MQKSMTAVSKGVIAAIGNITPYHYQHDLIEAIKEFVREQRKNFKKTGKTVAGFIEAYVSAGKTILLGGAANHFSKIGAKTLILARVGELVEQNADECWNMDAPNSVFSASLGIKSTHYSTVVGTEGTIANALDKELADFCPHVIMIDECHEVDWRECLKLIKDPSYETDNQYAKIIAHFKRKYPAVVIVGVTGTPYRGNESIEGPFWEEQIGYSVGRDFLVKEGYIVPTIFGYSDLEYDYHDFDGKEEEFGTADFSSSELKRMGDKADLTLTHKIMAEVMAVMENRLGALITCASEKHCKEAAQVLPDGSWAIITNKTKKADRRRILKEAKKGEIKYILQIGCLTTGVNVPFWDTSVLLRRIGSLTLLTQLLGRGMRLLKDEHFALGWKKSDHLVLDFSGTMESMQRLYDDPILERADLDRAKNRKKGGFKTCPKCEFENGPNARRCINEINDERCEHFWESKECPKCKAQNDRGAKACRKCDHALFDPNAALSGKHYTLDDWKEVESFKLQPTRNGALSVVITLKGVDHEGKKEVARLFYNPWKSPGAKKVFQFDFCQRFAVDFKAYRTLSSAPNVEFLLKNKALVGIPKQITHRKKDGGISVVHGLDFGKKVTMGGKIVDKDKARAE